MILKTEPHKAGKQWKFTGAFYYGDFLHILAAFSSIDQLIVPVNSFDRANNNRLWSFNPFHNGRKTVHHVLRNDWNSLRYDIVMNTITF